MNQIRYARSSGAEQVEAYEDSAPPQVLKRERDCEKAYEIKEQMLGASVQKRRCYELVGLPIAIRGKPKPEI